MVIVVIWIVILQVRQPRNKLNQLLLNWLGGQQLVEQFQPGQSFASNQLYVNNVLDYGLALYGSRLQEGKHWADECQLIGFKMIRLYLIRFRLHFNQANSEGDLCCSPFYHFLEDLGQFDLESQ